MDFSIFKYEKSRLSFATIRKWLLSYVSILLIPIVFSLYVYAEAEQIIRKEINAANALKLSQIQTIIDKRMTDVISLSLQLAWNPTLESILYRGYPLDASGRFAVNKLQRDLKLYRVANGYIDDIYIYLHNSRMIVTSATSYDIQLLETELEGIEKLSARQLIDLSGRSFQYYFNTMTVYAGTANERQTVSCALTLPVSKVDAPSATMVVMLDHATFLDEVMQRQGFDQGALMIIDESDHILCSTRQDNLFTSLTYMSVDNQMVSTMDLEETPYVVSSIQSAVNAWKYVYALPANVFLEKVEYLKRLVISSILVCLLIGVAVSFLFTRRNYKPLRSLVSSLPVRGRHEHATLDEYALIRETIESAVSEKNKVRQMLDAQAATIRSSLVARIVKGKPIANTNLADVSGDGQMTWLSDQYCVLLFYIENTSPLLANPNGEQKNDADLIRFIITNVAEELLNEHHLVLFSDVDDLLTGLVNIGTDQSYSARDLAEIAAQVQTFLSTSFQLSLTIAVSSIHTTLAGSAQCYAEAREALEYRLVLGPEQLLLYEDLDRPATTYAYSIEDEQKLLNAIKAGDLALTRQIAEDVFARHFRQQPISVEIARCLVFDLTGTLLKALNSVGPLEEEGKLFLESLNPANRLAASGTLADLQTEFLALAEAVCQFAGQNASNKGQKIAQRVIEVVQKRYADENLSSTGIADIFGLSGPYVAKMFKDQTGQSLPDYISKVRVEHAKSLLAASTDNLETIALKAGFSNKNSLIRVFKKLTGVTPGQFRDMSL